MHRSSLSIAARIAAAVLLGSPAIVTAQSWNRSHALSFESARQDLVTIPNQRIRWRPDLPTGDFTLRFWIRRDDSDQYQTVFDLGRRTAQDRTSWRISVVNSGGLVLDWQSENPPLDHEALVLTDGAGQPLLEPGVWNQVVVSQQYGPDWVESRFYVAGRDLGTAAVQRQSSGGQGSYRPPLRTSADLYMGGFVVPRPGGPSICVGSFDGDLDAVALWNRALDPVEVGALLAHSRRAERLPSGGLVAVWDLEPDANFPITVWDSSQGVLSGTRGLHGFRGAPCSSHRPEWVDGLPTLASPFVGQSFLAVVGGQTLLHCGGLGDTRAAPDASTANRAPLDLTALLSARAGTAVEIDALSFGLDIIEVQRRDPQNPNWPDYASGVIDMTDRGVWGERWTGLTFSVRGRPDPVADSQSLQTMRREAGAPGGAGSDLFGYVLPGSGGIHSRYPASGTLFGGQEVVKVADDTMFGAAADGNRSELRALDMHAAMLEMQDRVVDRLQGTQASSGPPLRVFFSLTAASAATVPAAWFQRLGTSTPVTRSGAAILAMDLFVRGTTSQWTDPRVLHSASDIGLSALDDDIDALSVDRRGVNQGPEPTRMVLSLTGASPSASHQLMYWLPRPGGGVIPLRIRYAIPGGVVLALADDLLLGTPSFTGTVEPENDVDAICIEDPTYRFDVQSNLDQRFVGSGPGPLDFHPLKEAMIWPVDGPRNAALNLSNEVASGVIHVGCDNDSDLHLVFLPEGHTVSLAIPYLFFPTATGQEAAAMHPADIAQMAPAAAIPLGNGVGEAFVQLDTSVSAPNYYFQIYWLSYDLLGAGQTSALMQMNW